jgi:hypothetical protein
MISADCNKFWTEGLELCSSRGCVMSCFWGVVCSFVRVYLATDCRELEATEDPELGSYPVAGEGVKQVCSVLSEMCHFHSLRALLQQAGGYCLLKGWDANCKYNLIYEQAAGLVCIKTAEFPCEVQICNWTEDHAVDLNVE